MEKTDKDIQLLPNLEFAPECMTKSQSIKTIIHEEWAPIEEWYINPEAILRLSILEQGRNSQTEIIPETKEDDVYLPHNGR